MNATDDDKEYFIATKDEKSEFLVYTSEQFKLSEIDLINMIKICLIEARSKAIGKKLLEVYRDSTEHRPHITQERLKLIGVKENGTTKPTQSKKPRVK
jgi:hypothetical protein